MREFSIFSLPLRDKYARISIFSVFCAALFIPADLQVNPGDLSIAEFIYQSSRYYLYHLPSLFLNLVHSTTIPLLMIYTLLMIFVNSRFLALSYYFYLSSVSVLDWALILLLSVTPAISFVGMWLPCLFVTLSVIVEASLILSKYRAANTSSETS